MIANVIGSPKSCHVLIEWDDSTKCFVAYVDVWPLATSDRLSQLAQWATMQGAATGGRRLSTHNISAVKLKPSTGDHQNEKPDRCLLRAVRLWWGRA